MIVKVTVEHGEKTEVFEGDTVILAIGMKGNGSGFINGDYDDLCRILVSSASQIRGALKEGAGDK